MRRLLRLAAIASLTVLIFYLLLLAALYAAQRSLIFPAPQEPVPAPPGYAQVGLTTSDGLKIKAAYHPADADKPTLVFFHGNGDDWRGADRATRSFVDHGYGVLLPEYRGYAGNLGSPGERGFYRDGRAAMDWLVAEGVATDRTYIIGNSIGSGVATEMAVEYQPRGLALISPFASLPGLVEYKFPWVPVRALLRDRFDNASKLSRFKGKVLLLHGTDDSLIPAGNSRELKVAAPRAVLELIGGAGHELAYLPIAQGKVLDWLQASGG